MKTIYLLLFSLFLLPLFGEPKPSLPEKTTRYYELLLERPESSTLFERFLNAWLDTHPKEELAAFLQNQAQGAGGEAKHALLLTTFHQWVGQETEALVVLDKALDQNPGAPSLLLARAKLKAQLLDFGGALVDLEKAGPLSTPEDLLLRGTWLARSGQIEQAVAFWKSLLAADPSNEHLAEDLIELEISEGLYQEALASLQQLIARTKDPYQKALRTLRLASVQERAGQSQEALTTYQGLLPLSGQGSWLEKEILAQVEESFRRQDNLVGLRDFYQILRQDLPQRISLKKGLAFQMARNGEEEEAIALFRDILMVTPGDRANRLQFVTLLEDLARYEAALSEITLLAREQPEEPNLLEHQARLYDQTGEREALQATLASLSKLREADANALLATATLYQRYKFPEQAEALLRRTSEKFPDLLEPREALASFLAAPDHEKAKQDEATQIWLALAQDADAEGLLRVARSLQNHNRALECFELIQGRLPEFPDDTLLLTQLCKVALLASRVEEAFPHALHLAKLAQAPTEFEAALKLVSQLARKLDLTDLIEELRGQEAKSSLEWCVLAELYQILNDFEASAQAIAQARQLDDSVLVASQEIRLLQSQGNWPEATARLRELIASPGGNRPANLNKLIRILIDSGDLPAALAEVEEWKKRAPGDKHAWLQRAELLTQSGRLQEAALELRRAHNKFDHDSDLRNRLAKALLAAGDYPAAQRLFLRIYQDSDDASARSLAVTELAHLAKQEGRTQELLAEFQRRKRQNPGETGPLLALARIYEIFEQYDQQHAALAEALRRRPQDSALRLQLSKLEENAGRIEQATATLREGLDLNSGPQLRQALADFYFRNGELERGLDLTISLNRDDPRAVEATVLTLCRQQEWELALRHLDRVSSADPRLQCLRVLTLLPLNQDEQAHPLLEQLLTDTTATFPPGLSVSLSPTFAQTAHWYQGSNHDFSSEQLLMDYFRGQIGNFLRNSSHNHYSYGFSRQASQFLPGTAAELRTFALAVILAESHTCSVPEEKAQFLAQFSIPQTPYYQSLFHPEFKQWLLTEFSSGRLTLLQIIPFLNRVDLPRESLTAAVDDPDFVAKHPTAAIAVARHLASHPSPGKDEPRDWFARICEIIPQLDEATRDRYLLEYSHSFISNQRLRHQGLGNFVNNHQELFYELVWDEIATQQSKQSSLGQKAWFHIIRETLRNNNRAADYLKILNLTCQEYAARPPKTNVTPTNTFSPWSGGGSASIWGHNPHAHQGSPSHVPRFPPTSSPLPPFVFQVFASRQSRSTEEQQVSEVQERFLKQWRKHIQEVTPPASATVNYGLLPESFLPFIPQIENQRVRALAYQWAGEQESLEALIARFAESNDPQLLYFAFNYYYDPQNLAKSFSILKKIPREELEREQRVELDRFWVQIGADLASRSLLSPEEESLVKKAALRYRRTTEANKNLNYVNNLLARIDPNLKKPLIQTSRSTQYRPGNGRRRTSQKIFEKVETLVLEGQLDQAAALSLRHLQSDYRLHRNLVANHSHKLIELIKSLPALKVLVLATNAPDKQESFQDRRFAGELYLALEDYETALKIVSKIAEQRPHDQMLSSRVEWLEAKIAHRHLLADPSQSVTLAEFTPLMKFANANRQSGPNTDQQKGTLPVYLAVATRTLNAAAPVELESAPLNWPTNLLSQSVGQTFFHDFGKQVPSLATPDREFDPERIRLIRDYITACQRHPQLVEIAFQIANGCRSALGYTPEQLSKFALKALAITTPPPRAEGEEDPLTLQRPQPNISIHQYQSPEIGPDSQRFLITWIARHQLADDSEEFQTLVAAFPEREEEARWARQMAGPDLEEAQSAFAAWQEGLEQLPQFNRHSKLALLANRLRDLSDIPGPPPLLETFHQAYLTLALDLWAESNFNQGTLLTPSFDDYLIGLRDSNQPLLLRSVLEEILTRSLGHPGIWPDYVDLVRNHQLPPPIRPLATSYRQIASLLVKDQGLQIFPTFFSLPPLASALTHSVFRNVLREGYAFETAEEGWLAFERVGLNEISWQAFAFEKESNTYLRSLSSHFQRKSETRKLLLAKLTALDAPSLKELLFCYHLDPEQELEDRILRFLEEKSAAFFALPEAEQQAVATLLQAPFPLGEAPSLDPPTPEAHRLLLSLNEDRRKHLYARLHKLINDGFTKEALVTTNHLTEREVIELVNLSLFERPALANELSVKYLTSLYEALKVNKPERANNELADTHRDLLYAVITPKRPLPDYLPYLAALETSAIASELPLAGHSSMSKHIKNFISALPEPADDQLFKRWSWNDFAEKLAPLSQTERNIFSYHLLIHHRIRASQKVAAYTQWTEDSDFQNRHPLLCRSLLLNTAVHHWKRCSPKEKATFLQIWQELLSDSAVPVHLRMSVATHISSRARDFAKEPAALLATLPLAREWLSQRGSIVDRNMLNLFRAYLTLAETEHSGELRPFLRECLQKIKADPLFSFGNNTNLRSSYLEALAPLFLQLQDRESFRSISSSLGDKLNGQPEILLLLAKMDDRKLVNRFLAREDALYSAFKLRWNSVTAQKVAHLLALVDDPQKRYRLECHLASVRDDTSAEDQTFVKRPQRLLALAQKFAELSPQVPLARIECLAQLNTPFDPERAAILEAPLAEIHQRWPLHRAWEGSSRLPSDTLRTISLAYLKHQASAGDLVPAISATESLLDHMRQNKHSSSSVKDNFASVNSLLIVEMLKWPKEGQEKRLDPRLHQLTQQFLQLLSQEERIERSLAGSFIHFTILTHHDAQTTADLEKLITEGVKTNSPNYRIALKALTYPHGGSFHADAIKEVKSEYFRSLTRSETISEHLFPRFLALLHLFTHLDFDEEELSQLCRQLPDDFPRKGEILIAAAVHMNNINRDPEVFVPYYDTALAWAEKAKDDELKTLALFYKAKGCQYRHREISADIIRTIDPALLPKDQKDAYPGLLKWAKKVETSSDQPATRRAVPD